jgi:transposase InsO family protein
MFLPINIPAGREIIPYPPSYRVKPVGYSGFGYPLPSLFLRRAQNEFGLRVKMIRSDNGPEFKNSQIEGFFEEEGIKHEFSSPYTPQQNGVVERKDRTLLDMGRTILDEYKTPDRFWAEAINTACYSIN